MPQTSPLVAFGTADDPTASPWTSSGTLTVTGGQIDPFGGTGAVLLTDTSAVAISGRRRNVTVTGTTPLIIAFVRNNNSAKSRLFLFDSTASVHRGQLDINWSGATLTSLGSVSGAVPVSAIAVGAGWYFVRYYGTGAVPGNTHFLQADPASTNVAATDSAYFYFRSAVIFDQQFDDALADELPRAGADWGQAPSGVEDAWLYGQDQVLSGTLRHIPPADSAGPHCSGWYGSGDDTMINVGVQAMLRAGRDKQSLRWVPDRTVCTTYQDSYLVEPMTQRIGLEGNGSPNRRIPITLRGSAVFAGY
ncbi:MAG TPA: hypothetical protein VJN95_08715 [Gemmatimonadales bacterium]|nr:hypothetical protein [Gemmatimonadales bacterium]